MLTFRSLFVLILGLVAPALAAGTVPIDLEGRAVVIDADTFDVADTRVRIHGIDAPEVQERCRQHNGAAWDCGRWAQFEAERRYQGALLRCQDLGERTHGRIVARCFHHGEDIALALLRDGVVQACPRFALQHAHSRAYIDAEKAAAIAGLGLFVGPANPRAGFCTDPGSPAPPVLGASARDEGADCRIKGNINAAGERIYHLPGQAHYSRTRIDEGRGQRWFCSEAEARAAGWRRARR